MYQDFDSPTKRMWERLFVKLYTIIRNTCDVRSLEISDKVASMYVKNECTDKSGICYNLYQDIGKLKESLKRIEDSYKYVSRESKTERLIYSYEQVLFRMCRQMFLCGVLMGQTTRANNNSSDLFNQNIIYGRFIGDRIKNFRENAGFTQQQVAEALNIDRSTYASYETNRAIPDLNTVVKLSKIFNIDYKYLLD